MDQAPAISVVMPVFNRERLVARSVKSILIQNCRDFEFIIVDDASSDSTREILEGVEDPRIRLVSMPVNCGHAMARNVGLNLPRAEFIATMDSDDVAMPDRLGAQLEFMRAHPDIDILGTNVFKFGDEGGVRQEHSPEDGMIKARLLLLNGAAMIHPTMMVRSGFLERHGLRYPMARTDVDHAFWIEAMVRGARFSVLQEHLLGYYRHADNLTAETSPDHANHQRRKTPMRARIMSLFFPGLTARESLAVAQCMEHGRRNTISDVRAAIAAIRKAIVDTESHWGEAKTEVIRILEELLQRANHALQLND